MKTIIMTFVAVVFLAVPAQAQAQTPWQQVAQQVSSAARQARENADKTKIIIEGERREITAEQDALKASINARQKRFDALKAEYESLLGRERELQEELAAQDHELKTIDGAIRTAAKQARDYFHESLTTPEFPEREAVLSTVLEPDKFPGLQGIRSLLSLFLDELRASGSVTRRTGEFIGQDGKDKSGELLRVAPSPWPIASPTGTWAFCGPTATAAG